MVPDVEKCHNNRLRDPRSLNVADIEHIVITCKDDNNNKNEHTMTMSFLIWEEGQELVTEHHSPLMHWKKVINLKKIVTNCPKMTKLMRDNDNFYST